MCPRSDNLEVYNWCEQGSEPDGWSSAEGVTGHGCLHLPLMELRKLLAEQDTGLMQGCSPHPYPSVPFLPFLRFSSPQTLQPPPRDVGSEVARLPLGFGKSWLTPTPLNRTVLHRYSFLSWGLGIFCLIPLCLEVLNPYWQVIAPVIGRYSQNSHHNILSSAVKDPTGVFKGGRTSRTGVVWGFPPV